ncbi:hypothetical protein RIF29_42414 [Crotalaria pallida]|uniref:Alginate lyase 2 domain-containing protein n=1 Tax=Crotalaria pallida TaxID=3830 RepID=A0AAN9HQ95_CROPI
MVLIPVLFVCYYNLAINHSTHHTCLSSRVPLDNSNFQVQKPYYNNVPVKQRYSFTNGVHKFWVFSNDKPHTPSSKTEPRTEIRITGYDYTSGVWQFEGSPVLVQNIYDRWFRVNVIHNVGASNVKVYVDGILKYDGADHGAATHYFKFGVYTQNNPSNYMESRWKDIKVFRRW